MSEQTPAELAANICRYIEQTNWPFDTRVEKVTEMLTRHLGDGRRAGMLEAAEIAVNHKIRGKDQTAMGFHTAIVNAANAKSE
jgi:hypothetical protein